MLIGLAFGLSVFDPANYLALRCATAHQGLESAAVSISVQTKGVYSVEKTGYSLTYDRKGAADLTIKRARPFRVVVTSEKTVEYDPTSHQYTEKAMPPEDLEATVRHSAGVLDELVASLISPGGVKTWLGNLRMGGLWKVVLDKDTFVISNSVPESLSRIVIDRSSHLLRKVETKASGFGTEWSFTYGPAPKAISFTPPAGAIKVDELNAEIVPPVFASAKAKVACERIFRRYDHPSGLGYIAESGDERYQVWIDKGRARQADSKADWMTDKARFTLLIPGSKTYVDAKTNMTKVVDAINTTGTRIEPLLKLLMRGINPFRFYFGQNTTVKVVGSMKAGGVSCTMLESTSQQGSISLVARDSDGFVLSLMSTQKGAQTAVTRRFRPQQVTESNFRLTPPPGWKERTLDDVAAESPQAIRNP